LAQYSRTWCIKPSWTETGFSSDTLVINLDAYRSEAE
jgi:hypothetical protein